MADAGITANDSAWRAPLPSVSNLNPRFIQRREVRSILILTAFWFWFTPIVIAAQHGPTVPTTEKVKDNGIYVFLSGDRVWIECGGERKLVDPFDPVSNHFVASYLIDQIGGDQGGGAVILLPNNKLLIAGGWSEERGAVSGTLATTELYNLAYRCFAGQPNCPDKTVPPRMNVARMAEGAMLLRNGKVLIYSGETNPPGDFQPIVKSTELYDWKTNTFAPANATASMNSGRTDANATLLSDGKLLIAGGINGHATELTTAELYESSTNTFATAGQLAIMNTARSGASAILLPNGRVLIAGGSKDGAGLNSVELYDPPHNCFAGHLGCADQTMPPTMHGKRAEPAAALLQNGQVLIAGGEEDVGKVLSTTDVYDPLTNTFAPANSTPVMNGPRSGASAVTLPGGNVLIAGGSDAETALNSIELYEPARQCFAGQQCGDRTLPAVMNAAHLDAAAALLSTGKVLVVGGSGDSGFDGDFFTELYDPSTNSFARPDAVPKVASGYTALPGMRLTALPDGKVLLAGGFNGRHSTRVTLLYDPEHNCFDGESSCPGLAEPPPLRWTRSDASLTRLRNGLVLIADGPIEDEAYSAAELYDPAHNCFAGDTHCPEKNAPGTMNQGRRGAATVSLADGSVLMAGGADKSGKILRSMEIYVPSANCFAGHQGCAAKDAPPPMEQARIDANASLLPNGKVLIVGGSSEKEIPLRSAELYDPVHNCMAGGPGCPDRDAPPPMNSARTYATATGLPDGRVLIAGGESGHQAVSTAGVKYWQEVPHASVELYIPQTNTFAPVASTPTMNSARTEAVAVLLPNGKVLIVGGEKEDHWLTSTELYDPRNNCFAGHGCRNVGN